MFALLTAALVATLVVAAPAACQSPSWAGSNLYFLHALPAAEQSRYIDTLASWGVKVVRLWGEFPALIHHTHPRGAPGFASPQPAQNPC